MIEFNKPTDKHAIAANCAVFLIENGQSIFGKWSGRMPAKQQRELFGVFLGKGEITIDGERDRVSHSRSVCFGTDYDTNFYPVAKLAELAVAGPTVRFR